MTCILFSCSQHLSQDIPGTVRNGQLLHIHLGRSKPCIRHAVVCLCRQDKPYSLQLTFLLRHGRTSHYDIAYKFAFYGLSLYRFRLRKIRLKESWVNRISVKINQKYETSECIRLEKNLPSTFHSSKYQWIFQQLKLYLIFCHQKNFVHYDINQLRSQILFTLLIKFILVIQDRQRLQILYRRLQYHYIICKSECRWVYHVGKEYIHSICCQTFLVCTDNTKTSLDRLVRI